LTLIGIFNYTHGKGASKEEKRESETERICPWQEETNDISNKIISEQQPVVHAVSSTTA
jgi:hypothetical protein